MNEAMVNSEGAALWTVSQGKGMALMLCNGGPGCCDYLEPVARMIEDIARVFRFEQRGCGRSEAKRPYDVLTCVRDLENIREHYGVSRWIIAGHSWGCDLALAYAVEHPDRVLGILAVSGGVIHKDQAWREQYHRLRATGAEVDLDYKFPVNLEVNREVSDSWKEFVRRPDLLRRLADLTVPALFLYGEHDIRPSWPVEQLARLMPKAEFVRIEGAAHIPWLTHQEEMRKQLREFVGLLRED